MKFLNKMEQKFGKYAISNLMYYVLGVRVLGVIISFINPEIYYAFLALDIEKIMQGQIWRFVTFLLAPYSISGIGIIFLAIEIYLYYMIGNALENAWGRFRFNLYFLSGILFNILATVILYMAIGESYSAGFDYIFRSMFFAFAMLYPNMQFLIYFVIPVKVKWLAWLYGLIIGYDVINNIRMGLSVTGTMRMQFFAVAIFILVALANFFIFFLLTRNYKRVSPRQVKRRRDFRREVKVDADGARHKCAVCGRTEKDSENLEFRFCSKCDGNYEYCSEHLFTHEHVTKH